jgi:hypothetical protein
VTDPEASCPPTDVLVALALDELTGRDRASALGHIVACPHCREELEALTATAEQVLRLAPTAEPPPGFESAVLARIDTSQGRRDPRPRALWLLVAAAAIVVVLATGVTVLLVGDSRSVVADAAMVTPTGQEVGTVWRHDDEPGWVFVSVPGWEVWEDPDSAPHQYELRATLVDGTTVILGPADLAMTDGSWGTTLPVEPDQLHRVAIVDETGHAWCEGTF